jgi:hypothetical protein
MLVMLRMAAFWAMEVRVGAGMVGGVGRLDGVVGRLEDWSTRLLDSHRQVQG